MRGLECHVSELECEWDHKLCACKQEIAETYQTKTCRVYILQESETIPWVFIQLYDQANTWNDIIENVEQIYPSLVAGTDLFIDTEGDLNDSSAPQVLFEVPHADFGQAIGVLKEE